ncbi:type III glutamate--ammonia ligase [Sphaerotilus mobilis]|uniref:Glutamine synthetase n=1 Tax=Sphaerotilus mobilis TaxID=47994 RepID=A0A4Q7LTF2_9BURK|nr:type III glutamate--ammonia ligase [Sphaerotilus mobilis]RZS58275.1 glutamine synthetase [Sphaerotilus mobilis]
MTQARIDELARQGVHTLLVQFTDVLGVPKGKLVPLDQLDAVLRDGAGFAGPSIAGTGLPRTGPRAEFMARGDLDTLKPLPWWPGVARIVGDGHVAGTPFDACPRQVLRRQIARLAAHGWQMQVGIEPEFFLLQRDAAGRWQPADPLDRLDKPSYDLQSLPRQTPLLQALRAALEADGAQVQQIDHEDAHGQYELNFRHADVLTSCDRLMLFKLAAQRLAEQHGCTCSFMPKPWADQPGSGMHFHVSLWDGERPVFEDLDEHGHLADPAYPAGTPRTSDRLARHFVAGVLAHSAALCALAAPTVNSYKRLVVGESLSGTSWAPAYVAHGPNNRTALVRTLPGRFEWRLPDASANPYLAAAGLIAAGLDGIARQLDPGPAVSDDLFTLDLAAIRARGIAVLPQSLAEAADALADDSVLADALGATLHTQLLALQRDEALRYARHVSDWELARYAAR